MEVPKLHGFYTKQSRQIAEWGPYIGPEGARYKWLANLCVALQVPLWVIFGVLVAIGIRGHHPLVEVLGYAVMALSLYLLIVQSSRFGRKGRATVRAWVATHPNPPYFGEIRDSLEGRG